MAPAAPQESMEYQLGCCWKERPPSVGLGAPLLAPCAQAADTRLLLMSQRKCQRPKFNAARARCPGPAFLGFTCLGQPGIWRSRASQAVVGMIDESTGGHVHSIVLEVQVYKLLHELPETMRGVRVQNQVVLTKATPLCWLSLVGGLTPRAPPFLVPRKRCYCLLIQSCRYGTRTVGAVIMELVWTANVPRMRP